MSSSVPPAPLSLAAFKPQAWPEAALVLRIIERLEAANFTTMFAGGAVRDALLGRVPGDFDLATTALPDDIQQTLQDKDIRFVLTGVDHGTVMVVSGGQKVEVTTLRRDIETDGRHAKVAFTDEWAEDAARRDLTINALYADAQGTIIDLVGGLADLAQGIVRFVGDPHLRVQEDALRILRFFRFQANYGRGPCDALGLAACAQARKELARLSGERIWGELQRLLIAPQASEILSVMHRHDILASVLPILGDPASQGLASLIRLEDRYAEADAIRRLACLLLPANDPNGLAGQIAHRLKLSRLMTERLAQCLLPGSLAEQDLPSLLHRHGKALILDRLLLDRARDHAETIPDSIWSLVSDWEDKALPLTGDDVLAAGVAPGVKVGQLLHEIEEWWLARARAPGREECLAELKRLLRAER